MVTIVEPIVVEKNGKFDMWEDGWTLVTKDNGWSAQYEHTVLVTENGVEVLT
jgi:methionyl aminopeptidase